MKCCTVFFVVVYLLNQAECKFQKRSENLDMDLETIETKDIARQNPPQQVKLPYLAAILADSVQFCAGPILTKRWVLTTASCMKHFKLFEIITDTTGMISFEDRVTTTTDCKHAHPEFDEELLQNDVGLLRLKQDAFPVSFSRQLPTFSSIFKKMKVQEDAASEVLNFFYLRAGANGKFQQFSEMGTKISYDTCEDYLLKSGALVQLKLIKLGRKKYGDKNYTVECMLMDSDMTQVQTPGIFIKTALNNSGNVDVLAICGNDRACIEKLVAELVVGLKLNIFPNSKQHLVQFSSMIAKVNFLALQKQIGIIPK